MADVLVGTLVVPTGWPGEVPESPLDGLIYGRQGSSLSWQPVLPLTGGTIYRAGGSDYNNVTNPLFMIRSDDSAIMYFDNPSAAVGANRYWAVGGWGNYFGIWDHPDWDVGIGVRYVQKDIEIWGTGGLSVSRNINCGGSVYTRGPNAIYWFADRSNAAAEWGWYALDGWARLHRSGDLIRINWAGIGYVGIQNPPHMHAFGWNGRINCYIDGIYQGDIGYSAEISDRVWKGGDTMTGRLNANGNQDGWGLHCANGGIHTNHNIYAGGSIDLGGSVNSAHDIIARSAFWVSGYHAEAQCVGARGLHASQWVTAGGNINCGHDLGVRNAIYLSDLHAVYNQDGWFSSHNLRSRTGIHVDSGDVRVAAGHVIANGAWLRASDSRIECHGFQTHAWATLDGHGIGNISGWLGTWSSFQAHDIYARGGFTVANAFYTSGSSCYVMWDGWCWGGWAAGGHDQGSVTIVLDGGRNPDGSQYQPSLQVRWGSAVIPGDGPWGYWSDSRLKRNIDNYTCGLQTLLKLRPVTFRYNERFCEVYGNCVRPVLDNTYVGLDADEALSVMPEIVRDLPPSRYCSSTLDGTPIKIINAGPVTYALINAVKELHADITQLKDRNDQLEARIAELGH